MTQQVYYRKWRPGSFGELVGQEHVATTLRQSIKQDRVSHSYLFCGPRGSGKTTTARIVAKAVNCLDLQDGDPCNACTVCLAVNDSRFMDIIELDAASNRGIDEIRDIREKVNFSPAQGRRKVYIIDEAHMLTDAASNAFLKTLEEPPGHVMFVLCTTEAHKVLPTIISRCQRFDFRRIPSELIYGRLVEMTDAEGATVEPEALRMVARYAAGSLRDAQNLLEQLVVSYGGSVGQQQVEDLLGLGHSDRWLELVNYLLMGNTSACLGIINQSAWEGADLSQLHRQSLELLRAAMLLSWGSKDSLDLPDHVVGQLEELVGRLPKWRIVWAIKLWGDVNMRYDSPSTLPLELAVVEIGAEQAAAPVGTEEQARPVPVQADTPPVPAQAKVVPAATPSSASNTEPRDEPAAPSVTEGPSKAVTLTPRTAGTPPEPAVASAGADNGLAGPWQATVRALGRHKGRKYNLGALLRDCKPDAISTDGDTLVLGFRHRANLERMQEEMDDPKGQRLVSETVKEYFGRSFGLELVLVEDDGAISGTPQSAQNSPLVRAAMGMGARILEEVEE